LPAEEVVMTWFARQRFVSILLVLGLGAVAWVTWDLARAQPQPPSPPAPLVKGDVILMRCDAAATDFPVSAYQGSPGAPGKKTGGCAEHLSVLLKDGFEIRNIGHYDDAKAAFVVYTLIR